MAEKTTQKELFARIAEVMSDDAEVVAMCEKYIDQLSRPRKKRENTEVAEFRAAVATAMEDAGIPVTLQELAEIMGASYQKVRPALTALQEAGVVHVQEKTSAKEKDHFYLDSAEVADDVEEDEVF